jgi:hypothetical protein
MRLRPPVAAERHPRRVTTRAAMDSLTALLDRLNLRARVVHRGCRGSGWLHGTAWPQPPRVDGGDLVFFGPHAARHDQPRSADGPRLDAPDAAKVPLAQGRTGFVCGVIQLVLPPALPRQSLPAQLIVRHREAGDTLARLLAMIIGDARLDRFGSLSRVERLCAALLLLVLRHGVEQGLIVRGPFGVLCVHDPER